MQASGEDGGAGANSPAATGATGTATSAKSHVNGGRFDFDDGGTYCGGWEEGKAHGHGVCTGPKGQGAYSGSWHYGFEVSGVYTWPSGSAFEGQWQNGKRHGLGVETRGRWIYRGEWTQGFKGRYGVRQSNTSNAKYEGTWANGLQDGYGSETYADEGTYQGQWLRGMRHGYGVRNSAPFGAASTYRANKAIRASMTSLRSTEGGAGGAGAEADKRDKRVDDSRGGFVLKMNSNEPTGRRKSLGSSNIKKTIFLGIKVRKQKSTGDLEKHISGSIRSTASSVSWVSTDSAQSAMTNASIPSDSNASFVIEDEKMDPNVTETYMGEWKNDKRTGYGVSERSDGLKYEGEWYNNKKYGYGVTTFTNGEKEEGKYKNNVLITNPKKKHLFLMRSAKFRERIDGAVSAAQRASKIALQKADIAISRTATARERAESADVAAMHARDDLAKAQIVAKQYAPDFKQPGLEKLKKLRDKYADYNQTDIVRSNNPVNQMSNEISSQINSDKVNPDHFVNVNAISQTSKKTALPNNQTDYLNAKLNNAQHHLPNNPGVPSHDLSNDISVLQQQQQLLQQQLLQQHQLQQQQHQQQQHQQQLQHQQQPMQNSVNNPTRGRNSISSLENNTSGPYRRSSVQPHAPRPYLGSTSQQSSIDHFDHYKRPPSRDSSVDRYSRATGRMGAAAPGSRQPSVDRVARPSVTPDRNVRSPSVVRGTTPIPTSTRNGSVVGSLKLAGQGEGNGSAIGNPSPFEDILLKKKNLGQDIIPSMNQPKRTESLYIAGGVANSVGAAGAGPMATAMPTAAAMPKNIVPQTTLSRKKSLPDFQELPRATGSMSREEVSALGSARREEVRRQADEKEKLRANPLLYLVSPQVKDWFSRQQLVIVILFVNISLAIMFFKLLT